MRPLQNGLVLQQDMPEGGLEGSQTDLSPTRCRRIIERLRYPEAQVLQVLSHGATTNEKTERTTRCQCCSDGIEDLMNTVRKIAGVTRSLRTHK